MPVAGKLVPSDYGSQRTVQARPVSGLACKAGRSCDACTGRFDVIGDLLPFLGSLILAEAIENRGDWRFRVFGTKVTALVGRDNQGKRLSDLDPDETRRVKSIFNRVVGPGEPAEFVHSRRQLLFTPESEGIALPLSDDGERINMILLLVLSVRQPAEATVEETRAATQASGAVGVGF